MGRIRFWTRTHSPARKRTTRVSKSIRRDRVAVLPGGCALHADYALGTSDCVWTSPHSGKGHEIGTHYNGHFCSDNPPGGHQWTTADWDSELEQFFAFMTEWQELNGYTDVPELIVPTDAVKGGRSECLEGDWDLMVPAWKKYGLTYDSSIPAPYNGIAWPEKKDDIWEFYMPQVYSPGFDDMTTAMDYNFWIKFNGGKEEPETAPELRDIVKGTYDYMYEQAYNGNRAPVLVANHFNKWNGDSFNPPAMDFMKEKCGQPETYCATYQDVIAWMELQDPAVLAELQAQAGRRQSRLTGAAPPPDP